LYAAPGALLLYAALGSSRQLITGPMAATAALSAATVAELVPVGAGDRFTAMTAALAITTGLAALLAGVLRLGFLASFISEPVLKGFIVGLALTILIGQVPKLLGIEKGSGDFFQQLWHVITHLGDTQGMTLLVGALSLAVVLALRRFAPGVPGSLVAVALGIAAVELLKLDRHGVSIVGPIKSGLPTLGAPAVHLRDFGSLAAGGVPNDPERGRRGGRSGHFVVVTVCVPRSTLNASKTSTGPSLQDSWGRGTVTYSPVIAPEVTVSRR
jgi:MFS superfamily sulfate permease-like transporter